PGEGPGPTSRCARRPARARNPSEVDASHRLDAALERVLDIAHLGHRVGDLHDLRWRVASRDDHVHGRGARRDVRDDLLDRDPTPIHRIRDLVEHHEPVLARRDLLPRHAPPLARHGLGALHVARVPREAVADRPPLDAQPRCRVALAGLPAVGLDELNDADLPSARHRAHRGAERSGRLAFAVAGVDYHQRRRLAGRPRGGIDRDLRALLHPRTGTTALPEPFIATTRTLAW